jgi:hypothetical protein
MPSAGCQWPAGSSLWDRGRRATRRDSNSGRVQIASGRGAWKLEWHWHVPFVVGSSEGQLRRFDTLTGPHL